MIKTRIVVNDPAKFDLRTGIYSTFTLGNNMARHFPGRVFQVQNERGEFAANDIDSYRAHFNDDKKQKMIGTRPVKISRDLDYFYRCYYGRKLEEVIGGSQAAVIGYGPKWPELLLPKADASGQHIDPLTARAGRLWGIDFLLAPLKQAVDRLSEACDLPDGEMPIPGYRTSKETTVFGGRIDEVAEQMHHCDTSLVRQATSRTALLQSAIEEIPFSLIPKGSLKFATAVGVFDVNALGLHVYDYHSERDTYMKAAGALVNIFRRLMKLIEPGGVLAMGRGGFYEGGIGMNMTLRWPFLEMSKKLGFSLIYMVPDGEEPCEYYAGEMCPHLFGFLNDGKRQVIEMRYPFPYGTFKPNNLGGISYADGEWADVESLPASAYKSSYKTVPNPVVNWVSRYIPQ